MDNKLTLNQYTQKLNELIKGKIDSNKVTAAYMEYCKMAGGRIVDEIDINLCKNNYFTVNENASGYFSQAWICLSDLNKYLVKEIPDSKFFKEYDNNYTIYNAMVIPQMIKQAGLETAEYYVVKWIMDDCVSTWEDDFILTPSFLNENDKMISFKDICGNNLVDVKKMEDIITMVLKLRNFDIDSIQKFILQFRKHIFMYEFIGNTDNTADNISIIVNGKSIKMAPMYDFDFCAGRKSVVERHFCVGRREGLEAILEQYKYDNQFISWVKNSVIPIDIIKLLSNNSFNKNKYKLSEHYVKYYSAFFYRQKEIVKHLIDKEQERSR